MRPTLDIVIRPLRRVGRPGAVGVLLAALLLWASTSAWPTVPTAAAGPPTGADPEYLDRILRGDFPTHEEDSPDAGREHPAATPPDDSREVASAEAAAEPAPEAKAAEKAPAAPKKDREARKATLSLGYPASGRMEKAVAIPLKGDHHAFLPFIKGRKTNWGTPELRSLVIRVAERVAKAHPRATLTLGNVSVRKGGKIRWSVSHQVGRDVDLLFFVEDKRGRPLDVKGFEHFGGDGRSREDKRRRFSDARNWATVAALIEDEEAQVQWIFVSNGLRTRLLEYARQNGASARTIKRAEQILLQPRTSTPHADHFHVRIYCSASQRITGCHDYPPRWDWVDGFDAEVAAEVKRLAKRLAHEDAHVRRRAIVSLERLEAYDTLAKVSPLLADKAESVRKAALRYVRRAGGPAAHEALASAIRATTDPGWAVRLTETLGRTTRPRQTGFLEQLLTKPAKTAPNLSAKTSQRDRLRAAAATALSRAGRPSSVPLLIRQLSDKSPTVRKAAAAALPYLTAHNVKGRWGKGTSKKRLKRQQKRWQRWYDRNRKASWPQWVRLGLKAKGIRFRGKMVSQRSIPKLVRATCRGGWLGHNAGRVLRGLVGDQPFTRCDTKLSCWRKWWKYNHKRFGHKSSRL